jgi:hypothetical protein
VVIPPVEVPPVVIPPVETPPAVIPPVEVPPVVIPPVEVPPVVIPPVEVPPVVIPPVEVPVVVPPVEVPPVVIPPVETPPVVIPPVETPPSEASAPLRFFSPTSFWNEEVPANAALDPSSSTVVAGLSELEQTEQNTKTGPAINTTSWSVPIYTVPADQPTVRVTLVNGTSAALQAAWSAVPLPSDAQPAAGTDKHLVVWQPSTDRMWEFWHLEKVGATWEAYWGGAMQDVSGNRGVYGPEAWQGAATSWGASASSLPLAGGLITLEDLERGVINHALAIAVPTTRIGVYASPAQRSDGATTEAYSLPEGAHLRLDPTLDLASLHLSRITLMLAEAAQRYGIFVRDTAGDVALYAEDPIPTGKEPYGGTHGYFEGQSAAKVLASFPWSHLQLLKMELHTDH